MKTKTYSVWIFSSVTIGYIIYLVCLLFKNGFPAGFTEFGALGDAFGTLNSLFTGLGFAGVVVTLFVQQKQIKSQEDENAQQDIRYQIDQYENTLHRYLSLYSQVLSEVSQQDQSGRFEGRDALTNSVQKIQLSIKENSTTFYPKGIRDRISSCNLQGEDKAIINMIQFEHHKCIKNNLYWQGRLIQTAHLLFKHLEERVPSDYDVSRARELVMSQLTYFECQYFFFACLSTKQFKEMAGYMSRSIFSQKKNKFKMTEIDRDLFEYAYKITLKEDVVQDEKFFDKEVYNKFRNKTKALRAKYRTMINDDAKS